MTLDPKDVHIRIMRAENGWLIRGGDDYARAADGRMFVALSPRQLAGLVQAWAEGQDKVSPDDTCERSFRGPRASTIVGSV